MAISYNWKVITLEREVSDGYVFHAEWYVSGTDGTHDAEAYGLVKLERPNGALIPYDSLTEATVLGWVEDKLGRDGVAAIEAKIASDIQEQASPQTAAGVPWS